MKNIITTILALLMISCNSQRDELNETNTGKTCVRAINFIQSKDYDSFRKLFPSSVLPSINSEQLIKTLDLSYELLKKYGVPKGEEIQHSLTLSINNHDSTWFHEVAYLFKNESLDLNTNPYTYEIRFSFMKKYGSDKIVGFHINSKPGVLANSKPSIPIINNVKLNSENVKLFRVYYDEGEKKTQFGNNKGIFALQGNKTIFYDSGLNLIFNKIFNELATVSFEKPEVFTHQLNYESKSEFIQADIMMNDRAYGIFIYLPIKDVGNYSDYIIVQQKQYSNLGYQYYVNKKQNPRLVTLLESIISKDWGKYYVQNP